MTPINIGNQPEPLFQGGDLYRMYYRGSQHGPDTGKTPPEVTSSHHPAK